MACQKNAWSNLLVKHEDNHWGVPLNNDIILMDPTVFTRNMPRLLSLMLMAGMSFNLTAQNIVRVNGHPVPSAASLPMQPQDIVVLGSTMLQLICPQLFTCIPLQMPSGAETEQLSIIKTYPEPGCSRLPQPLHVQLSDASHSMAKPGREKVSH